MQTAGDKDPESIATCPYNPAHRLPLFRMKRHLVKCRTNYPDLLMVSCPINIAHVIPQPELSFHVESCPDRVNIDRKAYIPEVIDQMMPVPVADLTPPSGECWDDAEYATYNPTKHVMEKPILRILNCESKSKRRDFRIEERNRISRINDEHTASTSKTVPAKELHAVSSKAACRRPLTKSAALGDKRNLDPYKVNDILQALDQDQKRLLDNLQTMGTEETPVIFPIKDTVPSDEQNENDNTQCKYLNSDFPALGHSNGSVKSVGRGGYASTLQGGRFKK